MIGRETERKVSEKSNSWITIQSIFKEDCVSTVKVQVMYKRFGFLFFAAAAFVLAVETQKKEPADP